MAIDSTRTPAPAREGAPANAVPAQIAKGALRRLAQAQLEPTPENYARAYAEELGTAPWPVLPAKSQVMLDRMATALSRDEATRAELTQSFTKVNGTAFDRVMQAATADEAAQSQGLAVLFERLVRGLERADRQWTRARKKESLQTVLDGSRADARRLQQRLSQLVSSWEDGPSDAPQESEAAALQATASATVSAAEAAVTAAASAEPSTASEKGVEPPSPTAAGSAAAAAEEAAWRSSINLLGGTLMRSLPADDSRSAPIAKALHHLVGDGIDTAPGTAWRENLDHECGQAERLLQRRNQLLVQMQGLCDELTAGLTDLAEDDSWARGQCEAMRQKLDEGLSARGLRSVSALLHTTRTRQHQLRGEREAARDALKGLIQQMLHEVGELGNTTGRFSESVGRYAATIESADSLEGLAGVVREMVAESHTVQGLVSLAQQRLHDEHARSVDLSERVQLLEGELRRLSDEVSTDQLTQVANRRGLIRAFDVEKSRVERGESALALGLLDVDNFKRLNDELGHAAGDEALKSLAERIQQCLRPADTVARYGGEEFVVMLPGTDIEEAQQVLSRMQRAMTQALFMHENRQVFVTFSAGVTPYRQGERLEDALERADEALYDAKRTGKNRTCVG